MFQNLPEDILILIIGLTDLQTLFNCLRLNWKIKNLIEGNHSFPKLNQLLLSKTKKIGFSKRSEISSIIYGLVEGYRNQLIKVKKRPIKIGGPTYKKLVQSGELLDIFEVERLLSSNKFVIIRGPVMVDKIIVDPNYRAAKFITVVGKFIHFDSAGGSFKFPPCCLDLFHIARNKKNIKNLILDPIL